MTDINEETITVDQSDSVQNQGEVQTPSSDQAGQALADTDAQAPNPDADAPKPEPKKSSGVHKRIGDLTYKAREAERQLEARNLEYKRLEMELAQLRQTPQQQHQTPQQGYYGRPQLDPYSPDFDEKAVLNSITQDVRAEIQREQAAQKQAESFEELRVKANEFVDTVPDPDVQEYLRSDYNGITTEMAEVMLGLPDDRKLMLATHMANNPQFVDDIATLPVHQQALRLATFEAQASAQAQAQAPAAQAASRVSSAPRPAPTVSGAGAAPKDPGKMSPDEYVAYRRKQRAQA